MSAYTAKKSNDPMQPDKQISFLNLVILVIQRYKLLKERYAILALLVRM